MTLRERLAGLNSGDPVIILSGKNTQRLELTTVDRRDRFGNIVTATNRTFSDNGYEIGHGYHGDSILGASQELKDEIRRRAVMRQILKIQDDFEQLPMEAIDQIMEIMDRYVTKGD